MMTFERDHLPREVRCELIVYEDLLVKRSGQALSCQPDQLRLVLGKPHARVQLVRGYYVGAFITVVAFEELVEGGSQIEARHDVDVSQEHVVRLAVFARQIAHVILRIDVTGSPGGLLARDAIGELSQGGLWFGTIDDVRQLEDTRLLLRRSFPRHGQREDHPLADRFVATSQIDQVTL